MDAGQAPAMSIIKNNKKSERDVKMKALKTGLTLAVCTATVLLAGCSLLGSSTPTVPANQTAAVQRGDLTVDITASGNLVLSHTEDLAFQIAGYVSDVLVEVGDPVKQGQVLAKVDTTDWDNHLTQLQDSLTSAQRTVTSKQRALAQAQLNLEQQKYNLNVIADVKKANDDLTNTQDRLKSAQQSMIMAKQDNTTIQYWQELMKNLNQDIAYKQRVLDDILSGYSTTLDPDVNTKIRLTELQMTLTQASVDDAQIAIDDANRGVREAQKNLDDAKATPTTVVATFDGFATAVSVAGGDQIFKGKVAVTIADPNKFEADILVSEKDIPSVKDGGQASVGIDSAPGYSVPAKITSIAPTATVQSGVVNYQVKVELSSNQPAPQAQTGQGTRPSTGSGQGQSSSSGGQSSQQGGSQSRTGRAAQSGITVQSVQLRQGLSVTVSIIIGQRNNVLLVPNRAIIRQGQNTTVQVTKDGVISSRIVKIGINSLQSTEITDGLSEGEQVVIQASTSSTSTPQFGGPAGGGIRIPGVGGIGR